MALKGLLAAAFALAFLIAAVPAQSVVCTPAQTANYTGAKLVGITGSTGWVYHYYNFTGFSTAQIIYPQTINYTVGLAPGSSYLLYANYRFGGPGNLSSTASMVFVLLNNTQRGCSAMRLFAYSGIVMPYNPSSLLSPQQATASAQKSGYNVTFGGPISLVPASNSTGIQHLVPGYSFSGKNYTVYSNAENGSVSSSGNAHIVSAPPGSISTSQIGSAGSALAGVYSFLKGVWGWIAGLLGIKG